MIDLFLAFALNNTNINNSSFKLEENNIKNNFYIAYSKTEEEIKQENISEKYENLELEHKYLQDNYNLLEKKYEKLLNRLDQLENTKKTENEKLESQITQETKPEIQNIENTENTDIVETGEIQETQEEEIPSLDLGIEKQIDFDPKAVWGPIKVNLLPDTKKTLSVILSQNISDMSDTEFAYFKNLFAYLLNTPSSRARFTELTGLGDREIADIYKYLDSNKSRFVVSKAVRVAVRTSTDWGVATQYGGLVQFLFELGKVNDQVVPDSLKFKILKGTPLYLDRIWQMVEYDCFSGQSKYCGNSAYIGVLDLNNDFKVSVEDVEIAKTSLNYTKEQINSKN